MHDLRRSSVIPVSQSPRQASFCETPDMRWYNCTYERAKTATQQALRGLWTKASPDPRNAPPNLHQLSIEHLWHLARQAKARDVSPSYSLKLAFDDAISHREMLNKWHMEQNRPGEEDGNRTHASFVYALKEIRKYLWPKTHRRPEPLQKEAKKKKTTEGGGDARRNSFTLLAVDDE